MSAFRCVFVVIVPIALFLLAPRVSAQPSSESDFDLPAGPAKAGLREFARRSGETLLFPTRLVDGLQTPAVRGRMSAQEALHRLLAGTGLDAVAAGAEGALTLRKADPEVVTLPAFLVRSDRDWGWLYGEFPGMSVLSACDPRLTQDFVRRLLQDQADFDQLVPPRFQGHDPEILILVPPAQAETIEAEMATVMRRTGGSLRTVPHLRIAEPGSSASYFIVDPSDRQGVRGTNKLLEWLGMLYDADDNYLHFNLAPEFVWYRLATAPHRLPSWLISGVIDLYSRSGDTPSGLYAAPIPSKEWTEAFGGRGAAAPLPPLAMLLAGPPFPQEDMADRRRLRLEAELLVRWALASDGANDPAALWKLVEGAGGRPVDEAQFRFAFGFGSAEAQTALTNFATVARTAAMRWARRRAFIRTPRFSPASAEQIDWAMIEWDRRVLITVRKERPELAAPYESQARVALARAARNQEPAGRLRTAIDRLRRDLEVQRVALRPDLPAVPIARVAIAAPAAPGAGTAAAYPLTVTASTSSAYHRSRLADGSVRPETFVFGEGPHRQGQRVDGTEARVTYDFVRRALVDPLRERGYVPALEMNKAELLLVVSWGTTATPGDRNLLPIKDSMEAAALAAASGGGVGAAQQVTDLKLQLDMMQAQVARAANASARELGYDPSAQQKYVEELQQDRYFVTVQAYRYGDWRSGRREIVWETRYSIDQHHAFDAELGAMTKRASKFFGGNSYGTVHDDLPVGHVEVGTPRSVGESVPADTREMK